MSWLSILREERVLSVNPVKMAQRGLYYSFARRRVVLELFGGLGGLTRTVYLKSAKKIYFVERSRECIEQAMNSLGSEKVVYFKMDNLKFLDNILGSLDESPDFVDFDASGFCGKQMRKFITSGYVQPPVVVCFTDGGLVAVAVSMGSPVNIDCIRKNWVYDEGDEISRDGYRKIIRNSVQLWAEDSGLKVVKYSDCWLSDNRSVHGYRVLIGGFELV